VMVLKTWAASCLDLEVFVPRLQLERNQALAKAQEWQQLFQDTQKQAQRLLEDRGVLIEKVQECDNWRNKAADRAPMWMLVLSAGAALIVGVVVGGLVR